MTMVHNVRAVLTGRSTVSGFNLAWFSFLSSKRRCVFGFHGAICDAFLLNEAYVADSKVEQQAFICVKGVVW